MSAIFLPPASGLDALADALVGDLEGWVVDHACTECGRRVTTIATWTERPTCCGWQMVDLIGTVRRG